jgi:hypothetical protein
MSLLARLRPPVRRAHPSRLAAAAILGLGALGAAACADAPSAPVGSTVRTTPRLELIDPAAFANGLVRDHANDKPIVTEIRVPRGGGTYRLPGGLHIDVSGGTFRETTTLTVTMLPGNMVAYEFQPHGLVFNKPLRMSQDLRGTNWAGKDVSQFGVGYFTSATDLNLLTKQALVKEYLRSTVDVHGKRVHFDVFHFSGYMMSTGLADRVEEIVPRDSASTIGEGY